MDYSALKKNIFDEIEEGQIKLGYREEEIRLYYPRASLCLLLGEELDAARMIAALEEFSRATADELGGVMVSRRKERFCLTVPAPGVRYVYEHTPREGFLVDFIALMGRHGCTMDEVRQLFRRYSERVYEERIQDGEFDWLICFEDGTPSDYFYCLTDEGHHMIYHRFTRADYEAMYGQAGL